MTVGMTVGELMRRLSMIDDNYRVKIDVRYNVIGVSEVNIKCDPVKKKPYVELR